MESQRCNYVAPLGDVHAPNEDVEIRGHKIPKGTMIFANYWTCLMDPVTFPDPHRFDPTRFLDKGNNVLKPREFIPFFLGELKYHNLWNIVHFDMFGVNIASNTVIIIIAMLFA